MKYKTLFRLMLKLLGVYFFFLGISGVIQAFYMVTFRYGSSIFSIRPFTPFVEWLKSFFSFAMTPGFEIAFGLYLFWGGKWITDKAIPSNRLYCPDCAYDLTGAVSDRCPECGCPIDLKQLTP